MFSSAIGNYKHSTNFCRHEGVPTYVHKKNYYEVNILKVKLKVREVQEVTSTL
jgi:hypothetical protein